MKWNGVEEKIGPVMWILHQMNRMSQEKGGGSKVKMV